MSPRYSIRDAAKYLTQNQYPIDLFSLTKLIGARELESQIDDNIVYVPQESLDELITHRNISQASSSTKPATKLISRSLEQEQSDVQAIPGTSQTTGTSQAILADSLESSFGEELSPANSVPNILATSISVIHPVPSFAMVAPADVEKEEEWRVHANYLLDDKLDGFIQRHTATKVRRRLEELSLMLGDQQLVISLLNQDYKETIFKIGSGDQTRYNARLLSARSLLEELHGPDYVPIIKQSPSSYLPHKLSSTLAQLEQERDSRKDSDKALGISTMLEIPIETVNNLQQEGWNVVYLHGQLVHGLGLGTGDPRIGKHSKQIRNFESDIRRYFEHTVKGEKYNKSEHRKVETALRSEGIIVYKKTKRADCVSLDSRWGKLTKTKFPALHEYLKDYVNRTGESGGPKYE
jgi:hypothetical protein